MTVAVVQSSALALPPLATNRRAGWNSAVVSLPGVLWLLLWFGINTGPWVLEGETHTALDQLHYVRTLGPLIALGLAILLLVGRGAVRSPGVSRCASGSFRALLPWLAYGMIALLASATSPNPPSAAYWALCYLSALAVLACFTHAPTARERLERCRHLNYFSWVISGGLLLALLYITRGALFVDQAGGMSGYGVVNRVGSTAGVGIARASGFARFAAIPALFAFVLAWRSAGVARVLWGGVAFGAATIVYLMQSRGAILGLAGGLAFAMLFMGKRSRVAGVLVLVFVVGALATGYDFGGQTEQVSRHLTRSGQAARGDVTSGRSRDWGVAWSQISESPLWGWGPQADRYFFHFHVHNTYLYAWLTAGLFGLLFFVLGFLRAWRLLARALATGAAERLGQQTTLIQVGCILAFFTIRSIPEVAGAMFGIDLLLLLPALAWLGALEQAHREEQQEEMQLDVVHPGGGAHE